MKFKSILIAISIIAVSCSEDSNNEQTCLQREWFRDIDDDGLGDPADSLISCSQPEGYVATKEVLEIEPPVVDQNFTVTPGTQEIYLLSETRADYGFALYTPSAYTNNHETGFPLLIYLHGGGGRGSGNTEASFNKVVFGITPPNLIKENRWNPPAPFIVASPQSSGLWQPERLHGFIGYLIENMNVDPSRIYMTGLSMGGRGTFDYVTQFGSRSYTAAVVPIAGWSTINEGRPFREVPLWAFHGDADNVINVTGSINMVTAINNNSPATRAKLTIFPEVNHFSWQRVYDNSGIGTAHSSYDAYNQSIYEWMLQYTRSPDLVE